MKKLKKNLGGKNSGQLLIVAALSIAVLISSTTIYVYEVSRETNSVKNNSISDFVLAVKQSTRNTMISSLVNVSNGGERTVLTDNLNSFSQALRSLYQFGTCQLNFTVLNDVGYDSGMRFSWNDSGLGISSAYADFTLKIYGVTSNTVVNYAVNVTTTLTVNGSYTIVENEEKLVNLTCKIYNEGEPALAKNMTVFYENLGSWVPVNSSNNLSITDYHNGTYNISFTVNTSSSSVQVSVHAYDSRSVLVQTNTTCNEA